MTPFDGLSPVVLVGVGGILGALARYALGERTNTETADTLAVNLLGSFLLGALLAAPVGDSLLLVTATGFCGAFTTFSSFAVETVELAESGDPARAVGNAVVTLAGALAAVVVGGAVAQLLL